MASNHPTISDTRHVATGEALAARGHWVDWRDDCTLLAGGRWAIVVHQELNILHGGADSRRPAYVLRW